MTGGVKAQLELQANRTEQYRRLFRKIRNLYVKVRERLVELGKPLNRV